jgi:SNF2 family DNA or RNA helicase
MQLTFTPDRKNIRFVPETTAEDTILTAFPALYKVRGERWAPAFPSILQNIVGRLKKKLKTPIQTKEKDIVDLLRKESTLLPIPDHFKYHTQPLEHQELALRFLYTRGGGGLLLDPGLGKTKVVLDYIALMGFKKSLIVCPVALRHVWLDEVRDHRPDKTIHIMESTNWNRSLISARQRVEKWEKILAELEEGTEKWKRARANVKSAEREVANIPNKREADLAAAAAADIIVINYNKAVIDTDLVSHGIATGVDFLSKNFKIDFVALDEALIKTHNSARTRDLLKLAAVVPYRVIMSGTLINNTALDAFAPIRFLQPALTGMAYGKFDQHYGIKIKPRGKSFEVTIGVSKANVQEIREILESCSIVMRKEDWLQLPQKNYHPVRFEMSEIQKAMYSGLVSNYVYTLPNGEVVAVDNGLGMLSKVQQIANGFLYYKEQEDDYLDILFGGEKKESPRKTYFFDEQPKLNVLGGLMDGDIAGRKFILWYNCQAEHELITRFLDRRGVSHLSVRGGTKDTGAIVRQFNTDPSVTVMICQAKAVNYGITVLGKDPEALEGIEEVLPEFSTRVYTHVFYSLNYSLEVFLQQQDRSHRIGQTHEVDYYILLAECEAETQVYEALQNKMVIRESVLVDFSKRLKPLV